MSELRDLYQETILDHGKRPRNYGALADADGRADGHNPLCGDRLTVFVKIDAGRIVEVRFAGTGCAISMASASMMTQALEGRPVADAARVFDAFHALVTGSGDEPSQVELGKLVAFQGVREFPVRVKCATLAWHTLRAALDRTAPADPVSTE